MVKIKKNKRRQHCHDQQKHFYFFVLLVDGMVGKEVQVILATLSQLMATKMDEPISYVKGWVTVQINGCKVVLPIAPRISSPKSLVDLVTRLCVGFSIGFITIKISLFIIVCAPSMFVHKPIVEYQPQ